jgi:hypothetical protein
VIPRRGGSYLNIIFASRKNSYSLSSNEERVGVRFPYFPDEIGINCESLGSGQKYAKTDIFLASIQRLDCKYTKFSSKMQALFKEIFVTPGKSLIYKEKK